MSRARAAALLVVVGLTACAGVRTRRTDLRDAVRSYNVAIRWGHVQKASAYIPAKQRAEFVARKRRALASMRIHEVHLRNVHLRQNNEVAVVLVQVAFSVGADPIIRTHLVQQRWRYQNDRWQLVARKRIQAKPGEESKPDDLY